MTTAVARDPFARGEYVRETIINRAPLESCDWCGQTPQRLYTYTWQSDGDVPSFRTTGRELFCNLDCFRSYTS